jgi:hypothetical protein
MLNPNDILAAFVAKLREIPELVLELDGDPANIVAWYDRGCGGSSIGNLRTAIIQMPKPGILVVWEGSGPSGNRGQLWGHRFRVFLRAAPEYAGDSPRGYATLFYWLVNGIPQGEAQRLIDIRVHPSCDQMNVPNAQRSQLVIDEAGNTLDFFEVPITFNEIGDN